MFKKNNFFLFLYLISCVYAVSNTINSSIPLNNPPDLDFITDKFFDEDLNTSFTVSATDIDDDVLEFSCNSSSDDIFCDVEGTLITLSASLNFNGQGNINISVSDGQGGFDSQDVLVIVNPINDTPDLDFITDKIFDEDSNTNFTVSATDSDNNLLEFSCNSLDDIFCDVEGTLVTLSASDNFNGEGNINISVSDGQGGSDNQDVLVIVNPINDTPVANAASITTNEDESI